MRKLSKSIYTPEKMVNSNFFYSFFYSQARTGRVDPHGNQIPKSDAKNSAKEIREGRIVQREKKTARRILQETIKYRRFSGSCSHRNKNGSSADKMKIKLREVKLKADQPNKSPCLRREQNRLGTKENSKVRVFSPRASAKCRVTAIEDLKKTKLRERV
ncbi:hypothetical protein HID58_073969 [Brassica napus]|uniref:(rape) hypothetical protein n=1 Tax=Brassica napus TaxID=3708 RepID=A0A816LCT5_BRANA|nr:hypothetical protein HID58_073969 [Brassica napus]CAF1946261.1 unnamed protein product [Brassica napus]